MSELKKSIAWVSLASKLLSFLQAIIPAFLVAWVEALRTKEARLENQLDYERYKNKANQTRWDMEKNIEQKDDTQIVDDFLGDSLPDSQQPDSNSSD